jgi:hypothetical protein
LDELKLGLNELEKKDQVFLVEAHMTAGLLPSECWRYMVDAIRFTIYQHHKFVVRVLANLWSGY